MVNASVVIVMLVLFMSLFAVLAVYATRYKKVPPDKAMVVYGRKMHPRSNIGYQVLSGGGKFILPIIENTDMLDLGVKEVVLELDNVRTDPYEGSVPVRVKLTVLYKISSEHNALMYAAECLMGKTEEEIKRIVEVVIEGTLRSIAATMTPRSIDLEREVVGVKVGVLAIHELLQVGIEIRALAIIRVHIKGVDKVG